MGDPTGPGSGLGARDSVPRGAASAATVAGDAAVVDPAGAGLALVRGTGASPNTRAANSCTSIGASDEAPNGLVLHRHAKCFSTASDSWFRRWTLESSCSHLLSSLNEARAACTNTGGSHTGASSTCMAWNKACWRLASSADKFNLQTPQAQRDA